MAAACLLAAWLSAARWRSLAETGGSSASPPAAICRSRPLLPRLAKYCRTSPLRAIEEEWDDEIESEEVLQRYKRLGMIDSTGLPTLTLLGEPHQRDPDREEEDSTTPEEMLVGLPQYVSRATHLAHLYSLAGYLETTSRKHLTAFC
ncbi:MAG: hypothetical protein SGPRY_006268 [Prymnesium sp.]